MVHSLELEWSGCMKYKMDEDDDNPRSSTEIFLFIQ